MNPRLVGTGGQLQWRFHKGFVGNADLRSLLKWVSPTIFRTLKFAIGELSQTEPVSAFDQKDVLPLVRETAPQAIQWTKFEVGFSY